MIRLRLRSVPPVRLDVGHIVPERLDSLSNDEICRLELRVGNRAEALGHWFAVEGEGGDALAFEGDCRRLDRIGAGMALGTIVVRGDAGAYAGAGMIGGTLQVDGAAGWGAATAMRGGMLRIAGDAGDGLGGAWPGESGGMRGGTVIVSGSAGARLGERMRRGLVVVAGDAGPGCGARMVAGTIVAGGRLGAHAGAGMRRGSIVAVGGAGRVPATFADCGVHDLVVIRLLERTLARLALPSIASRLGAMRRWMGDLSAGGKGELLLPT